MTPEVLIKMRRQAGMTQKELAYSLEISREHLANLEAGKHNISKDLEKKIGDILKKDIVMPCLPKKVTNRWRKDAISLPPLKPVSDLRETCRKYQEGRCLMSGCQITYPCYRRVA